MKKVFSFLLAFVMLLPLSITAFAAEIDYTSESPYADYNEETERQIDLLVQELVQLRLRSFTPQNSLAPAALTNNEERIFNSLRSLGAKIVGDDNLSPAESGIAAQAASTSSYTKNGVAGSKVTEKDYVIEGEYYDAPDAQAYQNFLTRFYQKLTAPSAKYYEKNSQGKDVLKHTVSAKSGLDTPYRY